MTTPTPQNNTKSRSSNFELLRLLAIAMIVLSHAAGHGFYDSSINTLTVESTGNRILLKSMLAGSLGVDIFVMISGWFLIGAKGVAGSKGVQLAARTWLYSVLGFVLLSVAPFSIVEAKAYLLPVTHGVYWFVTVYLITFLFCPYYNRLLNPSGGATPQSRRTMQGVILLCVAFFAVPYTLLKTPCSAADVPVFFMLYAIGGYLRLYRDTHPARLYLWGAVACAALWVGIPAFCELSGVERLTTLNSYFYAKNSLLTLAFSACIVALVSRIDFHSRWINRLATYAFPVYLISDHPLVRAYVYENVFRLHEMGESPWLGAYILCCTIAIFAACIVIDSVRRYLLMPLINTALPRVKALVYRWADGITAWLYGSR